MSRLSLTVRPFVTTIAAVVISLATCGQASAQGYISPFVGYNFSGDAGCPEITDCEDKNLNWGASLGVTGGLFGTELDFGYVNDFFGESDSYKSNVLTLMGNFLLAPRFGPVQPYGLFGLGLIRTTTDPGCPARTGPRTEETRMSTMSVHRGAVTVYWQPT